MVKYASPNSIRISSKRLGEGIVLEPGRILGVFPIMYRFSYLILATYQLQFLISPEYQLIGFQAKAFVEEIELL